MVLGDEVNNMMLEKMEEKIYNENNDDDKDDDNDKDDEVDEEILREKIISFERQSKSKPTLVQCQNKVVHQHFMNILASQAMTSDELLDEFL